MVLKSSIGRAFDREGDANENVQVVSMHRYNMSDEGARKGSLRHSEGHPTKKPMIQLTAQEPLPSKYTSGVQKSIRLGSGQRRSQSRVHRTCDATVGFPPTLLYQFIDEA